MLTHEKELAQQIQIKPIQYNNDAVKWNTRVPAKPLAYIFENTTDKAATAILTNNELLTGGYHEITIGLVRVDLLGRQFKVGEKFIVEVLNAKEEKPIMEVDLVEDSQHIVANIVQSMCSIKINVDTILRFYALPGDAFRVLLYPAHLYKLQRTLQTKSITSTP